MSIHSLPMSASPAACDSAQAIKLCWSSHREVIYDYGPVSKSWAGKTS